MKKAPSTTLVFVTSIVALAVSIVSFTVNLIQFVG